MTDPKSESARAPRVYRRIDGRRLGGVCAGFGAAGRLGVGWIRLAFVLGALCGGLGVAIYLACWLIMPPSDGAEERQGPGALVVLAWTSAAMLVLVVLGALSAAATVFGLGWVALAAAAATLAASLIPPGTARAGLGAARGGGAHVARRRRRAQPGPAGDPVGPHDRRPAVGGGRPQLDLPQRPRDARDRPAPHAASRDRTCRCGSRAESGARSSPSPRTAASASRFATRSIRSRASWRRC